MILPKEEQETHFSQTAEERIAGIWHVYTDDPIWLRKLDRMDAEDVEVESHGGKHYVFKKLYGSVSFRAKRKVSDKTRANLAEHLAEVRP